MSNKDQQIWHAKRLISLAARAACHASKRIRAGLPARIALQRADRLTRVSFDAWHKAIA